MNAGAGMIERGQDFRLPLKAAHSLGISDKLLRHDLQRDLPAETSVRSPVDRNHTSFAKIRSDLAMSAFPRSKNR